MAYASDDSNYDESQGSEDQEELQEEKVVVRKARPRWYAVQVASGCEK